VFPVAPATKTGLDPFDTATQRTLRHRLALAVSVLPLADEPQIGSRKMRSPRTFFCFISSAWRASTSPQPKIAIERYLADFIYQSLCAATSRFEP
jgi:hypothetical protein